jgi:hypothetical protein
MLIPVSRVRATAFYHSMRKQRAAQQRPPRVFRVLLSGPCSGIEDFNTEQFNQYEAAARRYYDSMRDASTVYRIFNPRAPHPAHRNNPQPTWEQYMRVCLAELAKCQEVITLPGWWRSRGAVLEVTTAKKLGIRVMRGTLHDDGVEPNFTLAEETGPTLEQISEIDDLALWWEVTNRYELDKTIPKCVEYGARGADLVAIGRDTAEIGKMATPVGVLDEAFWAELGIHFYLRGKIARSGEAFKNGVMPSYDTLFDSGVYSRMQQRVRHMGYWG